MKQAANTLTIVFALLAMAPVAMTQQASKGFDWLPAEIDRHDLDARVAKGDAPIPEIAITKTPKATADPAKFTRDYLVELKRFGIRNDGTAAVETSAGINRALQHAKTLDANRIVFPEGTYLISESDPIVLDHRDTIVDLNGATLKINPNAAPKYSIIDIIDGAENMRLTNGILLGDKNEHDFSSNNGSHEWGHGVIVHSGREIEIDHLHISQVTGDGANSRFTGARDRPELLARIAHSLYVKHFEPGGFSKSGAQAASDEKIRTIEACDLSKCEGQFEFGYSAGYLGYPFIKDRVYQAYFYDAQMQFIESSQCLQFRAVAIPAGAKFVHLEFNQPEVSDEPAHAGAGTGSFVGRITHFKSPTDVHFHDNTLIDNRRLGLGYCGGRRWLIEDNLFAGNGGTAPGFGVDFEDGWEFMQDVVFRNNRFRDNLKGDLVVCAGSELLFEGNSFENNVVVYGRPHNYTFRNNHFTGGKVGYSTRTGVAEIYGNSYRDCSLSIVFDTKAVADGLYRKPGQTIATPALTLVDETLTNVSEVTGTYFSLSGCKVSSSRFIAGDQTRMVNLRDCQLDGVSIDYQQDGPPVLVTLDNIAGNLEQSGPGLARRSPAP